MKELMFALSVCQPNEDVWRVVQGVKSRRIVHISPGMVLYIKSFMVKWLGCDTRLKSLQV